MLNALDELEARLRPTAGTDGAIAPAATPVPAPSTAGRRPAPWPLGVGVAATLALAAGAWWMTRERTPDFLTIDGRSPTASVVDDPIGAAAIAAGAAPAPEAATPPGPPADLAATAGAEPAATAATAPTAPPVDAPEAAPEPAAADPAFRSAPLGYDPRVPAARELAAAQRQIARLRLSAPPGDNASESLLAARALAPRDPQLPRLDAALVAAFGTQFEKALGEGETEAAATLWQRARRFVEQAGLSDSEAWAAVLARREAAVRALLADAAAQRDRRLLRRANEEIERYGLDASRFAAEVRAARVALLPRAGERLEGRGPAMRLVVAPDEGRSGLAAMESEVSRAEFLAFVQATSRPMSRCRGGFLERRTWADPGFTQTPRDPIVCVTAADAEAYAQWRGQRDGVRYRLPTAGEWAQLSRGAPSDCAGTRLACDRREGSVPSGEGRASPLGLRDTAGNVREWLAGGRVGGAGWRTPQARANAAATAPAGDERGQDDLGFRLVRAVALDDLLGANAARSR
jgi:hypothetical protein